MINENSNSYKPFLYNVNIEQNYEQFVGSVQITITIIVVLKV